MIFVWGSVCVCTSPWRHSAQFSVCSRRTVRDCTALAGVSAAYPAVGETARRQPSVGEVTARQHEVPIQGRPPVRVQEKRRGENQEEISRQSPCECGLRGQRRRSPPLFFFGGCRLLLSLYSVKAKEIELVTMFVILMLWFWFPAAVLFSAKQWLFMYEGLYRRVGTGCNTSFFSGIRSNSTARMLLIFFWQPACVRLGGGEEAYH